MADGASYGAMVGMGETYLAAFVLAVGLGEVMSGLIASVPILAGGLMQLVSPRAVRRLGSNRRWVVCCVLVQALSFVPLVCAALIGWIPAWAALLIASVYWGAGMAAGPAWNTWIGTLVPRPLRARYFARRTRLSQFAVMAGFITAGLSLQVANQSGHVLLAFAGLFAASGACRLFSGLFLAAHSEERRVPPQQQSAPINRQLHALYKGPEGRLLRYIILVQAAVQISGPYFSPYMLKQLRFSYGEFVMLIAVSFLAKVAFLPMCGRFAQRVGARRLLWLGGVGIVPLSGMWLVSDSLPWLMLVQVAAGAAWAAYELAFFLLFFDSIPESKRTGVLTLYNFANSAALVAGSLTGGLILKSLGPSHDSYCLLFALSSLGRALTIPLLRRVPDVLPRTVPEPMGLRTDAVRPQTGAEVRPITSSMPESVSPPPEVTVVVSPIVGSGRRLDAPDDAVPSPCRSPIGAPVAVGAE